MADVAEVKRKADRLVELTREQQCIKQEIDELKAFFEKFFGIGSMFKSHPDHQ